MDERPHSDTELLAQYRAILASTLDPVVTIDARGSIVTASDAIERVFGYTPDDLIGRNISILMPEPHRSNHDRYMDDYRARGVTNILGRTREFDARRRDGSTFPIELSVARVDVPGRDEPLFTGIIHDISERREAEAELERHRKHLEDLVEERTRELNQSLAQLRLADRLASIGSLAAGLGHDMSNIVFPIRCRLDALQQMNLEEKASQEVGAVRKWIDYLDELAKGLRLLAQDPESTEADGRTDLAEWWGQVGPLLAKGLPRHVTLVASLAAPLPAVAISPHKLTQLMLNLVVNAGEAIESSGQSQGRVEVLAAPERDRVRIEVVDDGPGMSDEVLARALDPF
ncbi:MAG: PAS domain S-box protein, partial [Phycisphaerales bacterium]|nr:PAS domain S-box protein [Phycisphaerales bacterium]